MDEAARKVFWSLLDTVTCSTMNFYHHCPFFFLHAFLFCLCQEHTISPYSWVLGGSFYSCITLSSCPCELVSQIMQVCRLVIMTVLIGYQKNRKTLASVYLYNVQHCKGLDRFNWKLLINSLRPSTTCFQQSKTPNSGWILELGDQKGPNNWDQARKWATHSG